MSAVPRVPARPLTLALIAAFAITLLPGGPARPARAFAPADGAVFINEIHYDNTGTDTGEAIEIAGPAGTNLSGWSLVLYNGADGAVYATIALTGTIDDEAGSGFGALFFPTAGIQNGSPDGLALVDASSTLRQFLSYEGTFAGVGSAANGQTSTSIGVSQNGAGAIGLSLQLKGTGSTYGDFAWAADSTSSFGSINTGQTFSTGDAAPEVESSSPADGATGVAANASITVTFSELVRLETGALTIDCIEASVDTTDPATVFEFVYIPPIPTGPCTIEIDGDLVHDADGDDPPDTMADDEIAFFVGTAPVPDINISQVYGGGGNANSTFTNDFIELYNPGTASQSLAGWSVQYAAAAGSTWSVTPLADSIPAGKHYLIQEAAGSGGTTPLPAPDVVASPAIAMAATAGKVALVRSTTPLSGTCPTSADIIDLVGYGLTANCFEGTGPTTAPSNTTAVLRRDDGATDTNDNAADFVAGAPNPRPSKEPAPTVSSTFPSNNATNVPKWAILTVTFSEPVDVAGTWFTVSCASTGGHSIAATRTAPNGFTLDPDADFAGGEACTLTVLAANVTDQDTDDPPDTMAADHVVNFTVAADLVCGAPATPIHDIQGDGLASPVQNQSFEIEGVVVGAFPGTNGFQGLHVQEEDIDADVDPSTSEGIFIFEPNGGATYGVGDRVRIRGRVTEFGNLTELTNLSNLHLCASGQPVPTASNVAMPFEASNSEAEAFEGMRVELVQPMTVTETFSLGRFGEIVIAAGGRLPIPTTVAEPGSAAFLAQVDENLRRRIIVDDGDNRQNLDPTLYPIGGLSASDTLRIGDTMTGGTFVLEQRFGNYRLQPTTDLPSFQVQNPRPLAPDAVDPDDPSDNLRIASLNVLNFFTTLDANPGSGNGPDICAPGANLECRGASSELEFDRQRDKVLSALLGLDADVVGLMEIENNATASVESLVDGLNDALGSEVYGYIDTGTIGTDAIKVAFIYQLDRASPIGDHEILDSSVDSRFIDTLNRPALAQTFESAATGGQVTVVVNHLKSKGSACAGDPDIGDGQGNCNGTRVAAAEALVDWIASDPTGSGDADAIVIGDLNSYALEDPIDVFVDADYANLIDTYVGDDAYSFVFGGESGYLDHALSRPTTTAQATGATEWHVNADEPIYLDYNVDFKAPGHITSLYAPDAFRSSDHDPVLVGLDLLAFDFGGFQSPANPGGTTIVNAGATLPVKFSLAGNQGLAVLDGNPTFQRQHCTTGATIGTPITTQSSEPFSYSAVTDTYTFAWKTQRAWVGWCGTLTVSLDDGRSYDLAGIRFKP